MKIMRPILVSVLALAACSKAENDKVDDGKGAPVSDKEIVVEDGVKAIPNMVIDEKGNPVLTEDGTPKVAGQKTGPDYQGEIPGVFQGAWAINQADCERGSGETRIRIGAHNVVFHEAEAEVKKTWREGPATLAEMEIKAEGEELRETHTFKMAADGLTLEYARGGQTYKYRSCKV